MRLNLTLTLALALALTLILTLTLTRTPSLTPTLTLCQAAYTYRAVECPWQYRPNTSDTDPLGCWRPSTGFR